MHCKLPNMVALMITGLVLVGCVDGQLGPSAGRDSETGDIQSVDRHIEAPEKFQKIGAARWDGRPTLGGIWVTHPSINEPMRGIMRNVDTGAFTVGTIFAQEPGLTGPEFQLSATAASELGVAAGDVATIDVTALRKANATDVANPPIDAPSIAPNRAGRVPPRPLL